MSNPGSKRELKSTLKRRVWEVIISIPFGIGFAFLFWYVNLSTGLQLFLTVICWGAVIVVIELIFLLISKLNAKKPKKRDPFAD